MTKHYSASAGGFFDDEIHSALPTDAVVITDDEYAALLEDQAKGQAITADAGGRPVASAQPGPTPAQQASTLSAAVKKFIDSAAQALGYDDILSAISYADDPTVPAFQAQGQALRAWRANVWKAALPPINAVAAGTASPVPTADQLIATLPAFVASAA
jgi:hypothetical protein